MYGDNRSSLEAAAEAAAKVNAMLIAKGKLKPSQVNHNQTTRKSGSSNLVIAEVDINDVPIVCRNMLTRGATQEEISKMSGSAVSTRGRYMAIEDRMRNPGERALYLCVQGPNQEAVDLAVKRINEIIQNAIKQRSSRFSPAIRPPPVMGGPRHGPPLNQPPPLMSIGPQPPVQTVAVIQEKLYIGLEHAPPSFDVKSKIMGVGGSFLNHIINETGAKVTLRGKGSGFIDPATGREAAFEPMHVHIQHTTGLGMQQAKQLAENLIQTVQTEYASFQQVLAAMPTPVNPGTAAFITGLQQTSLAGGNLFGPQPGITTLSHLQQQSLAQVQPPGVQLAAHPGMINPQVLPVSTPTSVVMSGTSLNSSLSNLAPSAIITPAPGLTVSAGGPALVVPTTLGTSLAPVPVVQSLPVSGQSIVAGPHPPTTVSSQVEAAAAAAAASAGLLPNTSLPPPMLQATPVPTGGTFDVPITDSQFIGAPAVNGGQPTHVILSQAPQQVAQIPVQMGGPQMASPFGGPAQGIAPGGATLATGPPLAQASAGPPGPGMQIVTQTALPPPGMPPPGAPLAQPQQFFSQYAPVSSGPPAYSIVTSSMIGSSSPATYTLATSTYTYGLKEDLPKRRFTEEKQEEKIPENLLGYQHGPPHLTNLMASGPPPPAGIAVTMVSNTIPVGQPYLATSIAEDARSQAFGNQAGNGVVMVGPPTSMAERTETDKHLMPPPNVKGLKRGHGGTGSQETEKKAKHGYEEENEDSAKLRGSKPLPQPPPPPPDAEHPDMLEQEHREHIEREREQREYFNPHFPGSKHQSYRPASPPGSHSPSQFEQMNQQQLPPYDQYSQNPQEQFSQGGQGPPPPHPLSSFEQGGQGQPAHPHPQFDQGGQGPPPPPHAQFDQFAPPQQFHPQQQLPPFSVSSSQSMAPYQSPPSPQPPYSQATIRAPEGQILVSQHNPIQPAQQNQLPPQFQNSALPPMPQNGFSQQFVSQASQSPFPPPPPPPQTQYPPPGMQYWVGPT